MAEAQKTERVRSTVPRPSMHAAGETSTREPMHDPTHVPARRRRLHKSTEAEDKFYIPLEEIPEGLTYEWKRWSNVGQEDPFYIARMREQGWEPVNPKNHPNWVPPGYNQPHIIKDGLILMERPVELTQEARKEQRQLAREQMNNVRERLGQTPQGEMTRDFDGVRPRVQHELGRMVPIED